MVSFWDKNGNKNFILKENICIIGKSYLSLPCFYEKTEMKEGEN